MKGLRFATISAPHFEPTRGISFGRGWAEMDPSAMPAAHQAILLKYTGHIIKVHPDDEARLGDFGLGLEGGRLVRLPEPQPAAEVDAAGEILSEDRDDGDKQEIEAPARKGKGGRSRG